MNRQQRLNSFSRSLLLTAILLILMAVTFTIYVRAEKRIDRANDSRYLSFLLADELRQSSDDLTRMARSYVATGEPRFKQYYHDILAIRDGRAPRPEGYQRLYWDRMLGVEQPQHPPTGRAIALTELMRRNGFTARELDLLRQSKLKSDRLAGLELEAMQLSETTGAGAAPARSRALALLHDRQYHHAKAAIMEPIDRFYRSLETRTNDAVRNAERAALAMRLLALAVGCGLMFMLWRTYRTLHDTLGGSVEQLHGQIARIGQGDFHSSMPAQIPADSVMGWLAETRARLAQIEQQRKNTEIAEQALVESEYRWKFAIEGSRDGVWDWDIGTDEARYSRRWKEMLGYREEEILPTNQEWVDRIHPEDRSYVAETMKAYLEGKSDIYQVEYRLRCKDDSYKWILGRGMVVSRGAQGEPLRMIGTHSDITQRKEMEEQLRLSEKKFSTAFRVSPDAINLTRLSDGTYLDINEGFSIISGYSAEEVIGRSALDLNIWVDPRDRARLVAGLREHGVVNNLEAQFRCKDGSTFTGMMSARMVEVEGEQTLLSITRDISQRKQAEEFLRESEANLRTLMDSMPAGVWWYDREGNVEYQNRCFQELFGYKPEEVPTLNDWVLRAYPDPEYRDSYLAARNENIAQAWRAGTMVPPRESRITCKDGSQRYVIINTQPALGRMVEIFTDITERELYLHQFQKMEKLESLGVLAGGIAHDFNNILTGILGNVSFARTLLEENHGAARLLHNAEQAANRAADLAHQLLTFAKGGQPVKKTVSVGKILREACSFVLHGSSVSAKISVPETLPDIEVDEGQISQVMNNIIINASQAMPEGGVIRVVASGETVEAANAMSLAAGSYVRLRITDTGCGISEEDQKRIFDPYFTTKTSGSGLGLASVHSIVTKHGGYIGVRSLLGAGTTFEMYLPASDKRAAPDDGLSAPEITVEPGGRSVLVMDDVELIREMTCQMVHSLGYRAEACVDGVEAIACYRAALEAGAPFSAVIMDLTVPGGMGGREAARHILALDPDAQLIVSSGYSTDPIMAEYDKFGFCATLMKPYTVIEITHTLRKVLSREPAQAAAQQGGATRVRRGPTILQ
jgi:two-component system, cell cycle sensor histidine kinase and response regulator CckA